MDVWSGDSSQQPEIVKNCFLAHPHTTWNIFSLSWVTFLDNCIRLICTTYNGMFPYFKLKINFPPLSLLYKEATLPPKGNASRASIVVVNIKVIGCMWHHTLWGEVLHSDCDSLLKERILNQTWIWQGWNLLNIFYLIRKHQVILPSSCLCLPVHSCKKAGSSSMLRPALRVSFWAPADNEISQGLESGDLSICSGSGISSL